MIDALGQPGRAVAVGPAERGWVAAARSAVVVRRAVLVLLALEGLTHVAIASLLATTVLVVSALRVQDADGAVAVGSVLAVAVVSASDDGRALAADADLALVARVVSIARGRLSADSDETIADLVVGAIGIGSADALAGLAIPVDADQVPFAVPIHLAFVGFDATLAFEVDALRPRRALEVGSALPREDAALGHTLVAGGAGSISSAFCELDALVVLAVVALPAILVLEALPLELAPPLLAREARLAVLVHLALEARLVVGEAPSVLTKPAAWAVFVEAALLVGRLELAEAELADLTPVTIQVHLALEGWQIDAGAVEACTPSAAAVFVVDTAVDADALVVDALEPAEVGAVVAIPAQERRDADPRRATPAARTVFIGLAEGVDAATDVAALSWVAVAVAATFRLGEAHPVLALQAVGAILVPPAELEHSAVGPDARQIVRAVQVDPALHVGYASSCEGVADLPCLAV
jgi:hypothetical protein